MHPQSRHMILITRPEPQASRFAAVLQQRYGGLVTPVLAPLMQPVSLRPDLPAGAFGSVVFTSESGVRAVAGWSGLPRHAFCVGPRTAEIAQSQGFSVEVAEGDAPSLLRLILTRPDAGPFLHLHGREVTGDITGDLRLAGLGAEGLVVYAQNALPLSGAARELLMGRAVVILPLFSPRSARLLRAAMDQLPQWAPLRLVALSSAVAMAFGSAKDAEILTASAPDQAELLLQMDRYILSA